MDASIQQMEAFAELVKNVSKSVDEYMRDNVTANQARDYLADRYPDHLQVDISGETPKVVPKEDADESDMPDFFKDLGLACRSTLWTRRSPRRSWFPRPGSRWRSTGSGCC